MKLLIGYDGSKCADAPLDDLQRAGLPREAEAVVLSVAGLWPPPPPPSSYEIVESFLDARPSETDVATGDWQAQIRNAVRELALEVGNRLQRSFKDWEVRAEWRFGSPASEIIHRAAESAPDLIVVGSHRRSAVGCWSWVASRIGC